MRLRLGLAAIVSVLFALPAGAHHSHGNYVDTFTDITGVVKEVHLLLPHSWVYIEVKGKTGEPELWALEATGRNQLTGQGVTAEYIKPGDTIKVRCHILRDGSNGCLLGFLKAKDGSIKDWDNGRTVTTPMADF